MGKAQTRATNKYINKAYDRINLTVEKGLKDLIKAHADKHDNGSVNAFINRAIKETMERDNNPRYILDGGEPLHVDWSKEEEEG